jgi:membrane protease YdiL (CAAX protease family)
MGMAVVTTEVAALGLARFGLAGSAAATLLGVLLASAVTLRMDGRGLGALGFHLAPSVPREALLGGLLGVGLVVVVVGLMAVAGVVRWVPGGGSLPAWVGGALGAAGLLMLPAAAEEALLRGYPLQALSEEWGPAWGLGLTSVAFGALHLANPGATALGAVNTGAAGLFLGVVYLRTGSLWWASGAHLGWNWGLGYLAGLPVSGLTVVTSPPAQGLLHGPAWLTGGSFGPEGSVVATLGFLAAAAACWWGSWLAPEPAALERRPLALAGPRDERERDPTAA